MIYKYKIKQTALYKKSLRNAVKRGLNISLLEEAVLILAKGDKLPEKYRDHQLKGDFSKFRECHIQNDWLLVYRIIDDILVLSLHSTGTHSDIFGE